MQNITIEGPSERTDEIRFAALKRSPQEGRGSTQERKQLKSYWVIGGPEVPAVVTCIEVGWQYGGASKH